MKKVFNKQLGEEVYRVKNRWEAAKFKKPCYTDREVAMLTGTPLDVLKGVHEAKKVFAGARLEEIIYGKV